MIHPIVQGVEIVVSGVGRVLENGEVTQTIETGRPAYACMLGGVDGKRLFICTADASGNDAQKNPTGRIEYVDVDESAHGMIAMFPKDVVEMRNRMESGKKMLKKIAIQNNKTVSQIAGNHNVHTTLVNAWRNFAKRI